MQFHPFILCIALAFSGIVRALSLAAKRATVCNGHAELCSRSYANVTYIGAHNSFAYSADLLALARDQAVNVPSQLQLGVRLLQGQAHENDGELHFCHTSCALFDGGRVQDYLAEVKTFLDANPNEVITFIFTNPEGLSVKDWWKPAFDAAGITPLAYVPPTIPTPRSAWPTLSQMIDSGKRVVVFLDAGADTTSVDFILPEFQMIWETPFTVTDPTFPCNVNRISGSLSIADHMYMINHSLNKNILPIGDGVIVSDPFSAPTTNGVASIMANANGCIPLSGSDGQTYAPNFILLDYVNLGDAFKAGDLLNGIPTWDELNLSFSHFDVTTPSDVPGTFTSSVQNNTNVNPNGNSTQTSGATVGRRRIGMARHPVPGEGSFGDGMMETGIMFTLILCTNVLVGELNYIL